MREFDIIIIGAGPVGLTFAASLAESRLRVALVEQLPRQSLALPPCDGREIALTQRSVRTLESCGVWQHVPPSEVSPLRAARVWNGRSTYHLHIAKPLSKEPLGFLVSHQLLRRAAWRRAHTSTRLTLFCDSRVVALAPTNGGSANRVTLEDGRVLSAPLSVSADSRFSATRRAVGIPASSQDFGRTMLVCRMHHAVAHEGIAWEWFDHGQTLALLPLNGGFLSSVVITVDELQARRLREMSELEFNAEMERRFRGRLGSMQLRGDRHAYPLVGVYADRFVAQRHALIGDAAVGMHPVTAHGFNLGLQGQTALCREILAEKHRGGDIGGAALLSRYQRKHRRATWPLYVATNALVRFYTAEAPPLRLARHALLRAADRFTPFRRAVGAML